MRFFYVCLLVAMPGVRAVALERWEPAEASIRIKIGYTLGTHELTSKVVTGQLDQAGGGLESISGRLSVPLLEIKEGNEKLECHMRSSLGLDYEKSEFPESHVCDDQHRLPAEGPNSVVFPEIDLFVEKLNKISEAEYGVEGYWQIHGVKRATKDLKISLRNSGVEAVSVGQFVFRLEDFGVVVKKAFIISVSDKVTVDWSVQFRKREVVK